MAGGGRAVGRGGRVSARAEDRGVLQPALAGVMASLVGFASSFAVVLAGLRAVGADAGQAASGLLVLCVGMGVTAIVLSRRQRLPLNIAWSTPGAALLIAAGPVHGGYPAALGAFLAALPGPMALVRATLSDGREVVGFTCETAALVGAPDISRHGSWPAYLASASV